jgi:hypothetical protein
MRADSAYGDQHGFRSELAEVGLPFVMAPSRAAAPGLRPRTRTPPSMRPARWPGTGQMIPAAGTR